MDQARRYGWICFQLDNSTGCKSNIDDHQNLLIAHQAITHILSQDDPTVTVDPKMTAILAVYSLIFTRWSLAVTPANYPNFIWFVGIYGRDFDSFALSSHSINAAMQTALLGKYGWTMNKKDEKPQVEAAPIEEKR